MNTLSYFQLAIVLILGLVCSITLAQQPVESSETAGYRGPASQYNRVARAANQLRNMMRIGRRSDPSMPVQPEEMYGNQVDYSRFFRPNGFF